MKRGFVASAVVLGMGLVGTAHADEIADFYKGKSVTMVVGSSPGGGYDAYGRLVAAHLGKHIPGTPTIVVQNMPGAGQSLAAHYVFSIAPKDGTAIAATSPGALLAPLIGGPKITYDPLKANYIGSANHEIYACFVRTDAPASTFNDTLTKELVLGVSGGTTRDMPLISMALLGIKYKMVSGYKGSRDVNLAVERGEVQGLCGLSYASFRTQYPTYKQDGKLRVLVQESMVGHPDLNKQGVPLVASLAKTEDQRQQLALVFNQGLFGRPFLMAPEVPPARVAALRKAFADTMKDPALLTDARKRQLDIDWLSGSDVEKAIHAAYATPKALVEQVRNVLATDKPTK